MRFPVFLDFSAIFLYDETYMTEKIGIMGVGTVGGAVRFYFEKNGARPLLFDTGKNLGSIEEANQADIIFICVPTPFDPPPPRGRGRGCDLSYVEDAVSNIQGEKIVVIKSTVVPGTTEALQQKYPQHKFLFNPEFLTEANAVKDMEFPPRQIIGFTKQSQDVAEKVMQILPRAAFEKVMPATEAEMVKLFGNSFLSTKVIFGNQIYDLCQQLGINYDNVMIAAAADKRIGSSHLKIQDSGYRGYGGSCFPKDMKSLIQFADSKGVDLKLHKAVDAINDKLMREQGIKSPEKPKE